MDYYIQKDTLNYVYNSFGMAHNKHLEYKIHFFNRGYSIYSLNGANLTQPHYSIIIITKTNISKIDICFFLLNSIFYKFTSI